MVNLRFRATYVVHLRLIRKLVVDFILVIFELFFARSKGWGATSEYRLEIAVFEAVGSVWPKISGRRERPRSFCHNSRTDGQTDIQTDRRAALR